MRRLIISDTHLGKRFSNRKCRYLENLFKKYDEIILNGDFWDYYSLSFDSFIKSEWNRLFPVMKEKTVYIYGNHDKRKWSDSRVSLFSKTQSDNFQLEVFGRKVIFTHGHLIEDFKQIESEKLIKVYRGLRVHNVGMALDYLIMFLRVNRYKKINNYAKNLKSNELLVCGHKHISKVNLKNRYVIGGSVLFRRSTYLELDEKGYLKVLREGY